MIREMLGCHQRTPTCHVTMEWRKEPRANKEGKRVCWYREVRLCLFLCNTLRYTTTPMFVCKTLYDFFWVCVCYRDFFGSAAGPSSTTLRSGCAVQTDDSVPSKVVAGKALRPRVLLKTLKNHAFDRSASTGSCHHAAKMCHAVTACCPITRLNYKNNFSTP